MHRSSLALSLIALLALCTASRAQTPISGALSDGAGGPLLSGVVYHAGSINVPAGQTLTIQPGAIVKFNLDATFSVAGNLLVQGNGGMPVIFTALTDDSAGGDTNGDGLSVGTAGWWRTLAFSGNATATMSHLDLRFAGRFSNGGVEVGAGTTIGMTGCIIRDCQAMALDLNGQATATVTADGCQFNDCDSAVQNALLSHVPGFTNNTATGNTVHDSIEVDATTLSSGTTAITTANMISNVILCSGITVGAGATLVLDQGCILKVGLDTTITIDGTLMATGTAGNPVVITIVRDDAHGGDSNNDGAVTVPAPDFWRTLVFNASAGASVLTETEVWYAGRFSNAGIEIAGAALTLDSCRVRNCSGAALDMNDQEAGLSVTGCDFQGCDRAVEGVPLESVHGFTNCAASNNTTHDSLAVSSGSIAGTTTVSKDDMISNVIICPGIDVSTGASLTFGEGCIVKWLFDASLVADGDLFCNGTQAEPVIFTSLTDDAHGGDTNNDSNASLPAPDFWRRVTFNATSNSVLTHTDLWYGGRFSNAGFEIFGAPVTLDSCSVNHCSGAGLDMNDTPAALTVQDCAFAANDRAVEGVPLESVPGFTDCIASGNTTHDTIDVASATLTSGTTTITTSNTLSNVIYCPGTTIAAGAKLSLGAGVIFKMKFDSTITVNGELECLGTPGSDVVFTDFRDDGHGGDTNKDGPSSGAADWWRTTVFNPGSAASRMEHTIFRYAGRFNNPGLTVADDVTLSSCTVDSCSVEGMDLGGQPVKPTIESCNVLDCGGIAYDGMLWGSFANIVDVQATGNGGNYARVTGGSVGTNDRVFHYAAPDGVIVMATNPAFEIGDSLVIEQGVIVKMEFDRSFVVANGTFEARGTAFEPVVFTDFRDDDFGGDSNGDGASSGAADWWRTFGVTSGAASATLDHMWVRYAGRFNNPGVSLDNPSASVRALHVDHCSREGAEVFQMAGDAANWLIHDCGEAGIHLPVATAPDVVHATVENCAAGGISAATSWAGTVTNTISWNNPAGNFVGVNDTSIFSSNGSPTAAGMNGNTNVDPSFVNALANDYALMPGSQCIGTADIAAADALQEDHAETSRRSDDDLSGMLLPDMGALERITFNLDVQGEPAIGGAQTYAFTGPMSAFGALLVTPLNQVNTFFPGYGWLLVSPPGQVSIVSAMAPGVPLVAAFPNLPVLIGYPFQAQAIVVDMTNPTRGNFTQRYRARIRP